MRKIKAQRVYQEAFVVSQCDILALRLLLTSVALRKRSNLLLWQSYLRGLTAELSRNIEVSSLEPGLLMQILLAGQ